MATTIYTAAPELLITLESELRGARSLETEGSYPYPYPYPCPEPEPPDTTPPEVTFVSPPEGTAIGVNDVLTFDVSDDVGLRRVMAVVLTPATGDQELVHDGVAFTARYTAHSTRETIVGGYRFRVRRTGGWASGRSVTIRVFAVDTHGNVEE